VLGSRRLRSRIILLDLLFNVLLGLAFALCARDRVRADGPFASPAFLLVLTFVGLVVLPAGLYLYVAHPAWTWMYMLDPSDVPGLAVVPMLAIHGGALVAGYYGGGQLVRADRQKALVYSLAGGWVLLGLLVLLLRERLFSYGTYLDWQRNTALDLMDVKLGYVLIALILGIGVAAGYVALELFRDSRRVRTR